MTRKKLTHPWVRGEIVPWIFKGPGLQRTSVPSNEHLVSQMCFKKLVYASRTGRIWLIDTCHGWHSECTNYPVLQDAPHPLWTKHVRLRLLYQFLRHFYDQVFNLSMEHLFSILNTFFGKKIYLADSHHCIIFRKIWWSDPFFNIKKNSVCNTGSTFNTHVSVIPWTYKDEGYVFFYIFYFFI